MGKRRYRSAGSLPRGLRRRAAAIELLVVDVDGVLTDGSIIFDNHGVESKAFHVRDGSGIKLWQLAGKKAAIITGRTSHVVEVRAAELAIDLVRQGAKDKRETMQDLLGAEGLEPGQVCFVGDDVPDLPALRAAGLAVAVADACPEVLAVAHYVTPSAGGRGAVREVIEVVLKAQRLWEPLLARFQ